MVAASLVRAYEVEITRNIYIFVYVYTVYAVIVFSVTGVAGNPPRIRAAQHGCARIPRRDNLAFPAAGGAESQKWANSNGLALAEIGQIRYNLRVSSDGMDYLNEAHSR